MATYSLLPTEEPEATIAQPDTDSDKKASVNISVSCPSNNFCTGRLIYVLLVAAIVSIFVFVAVYQTVLKATLVVVVVAIIVVLSYVAYFYINKRWNVMAQKNGKPSAKKKQEEDTESTTEPAVNLGDIESVACREEKDDVEIIDLDLPVATGFQSDDAVDRTPLIITEKDIADETQEKSLRHSVSANPGTPLAERLRTRGYLDAETGLISTMGVVGAGMIAGVAFNRYTGGAAIGLVDHATFFTQNVMEEYFKVIAREMPADWQQLATNLGLPWAQIRAVDRQHSGDCWSCCQQVLDMWRKNNGRGARTEDLIQAVRETGNQGVAEKLGAMEIEVQPWVPFPRPKHRAPLPPVPTQHKD